MGWSDGMTPAVKREAQDAHDLYVFEKQKQLEAEGRDSTLARWAKCGDCGATFIGFPRALKGKAGCYCPACTLALGLHRPADRRSVKVPANIPTPSTPASRAAQED